MYQTFIMLGLAVYQKTRPYEFLSKKKMSTIILAVVSVVFVAFRRRLFLNKHFPKLYNSKRLTAQK